MSGWELFYGEWDPDEQPRREALCALGNGYFVTRGADETQRAHGRHYPGTYFAGAYNRAESRIAGQRIVNEDLVNWPNWLFLTWRPRGGEWFDIDEVELLSFEQRLDLHRGLLTRNMRFRDAEGRTTSLVSRRFVSMDDEHLGAVQWKLTPEDWSGTIELRSEIDGRVRNENVERYSDLTSVHHAIVATERTGDDRVRLVAETHQSKLRVAMAARLRVGDVEPEERLFLDAGDRAGELVTLRLNRGEPLYVEKTVGVYTSRDHAISEPAIEADKTVERADAFDNLLSRHERAWGRLWRRFDLHIGDEDAQGLLRLHTFHLLQTASPRSIELDAGIPARGWHGEAYRGHILWDELFIFPLLNLRMPDLTRTLLMYRHRRLREARANARSQGKRGACFPWQSGSNGREESQVIHLNPASGRWIPDNSNLQRHINHAIAYNVWQYYEVTQDCEFFCGCGAELLIEIARYLADLAEEGEDGRFHIRGVMGPDEFHERYPDADEPGLDDNAYTNVMTSWVLARMPRLAEIIGAHRWEEFRHDLEIEEDEIRRWDEVSRRMFVPFHGDGIISQYDGFELLEEIDWDRFREKYDNLQRMDRILEAEGESPARYKVAKQADVLMLFFLFSMEQLDEIFDRLSYSFSGDQLPRNIDYYLERTSHGSTLSRIVHAWVLARSDRERSWRLFTDALRSDIDDVQGGTTPEGIHLGAMAGTVDLVHRCYTGLEIHDDALRLNPRLPREARSLRLGVQFRGQWLHIRIECEEIELELDGECSQPMKLMLRDEWIELTPGTPRRFPTPHESVTRRPSLEHH